MKTKIFLVILILLLSGCTNQSRVSVSPERNPEQACTYPETNIYSSLAATEDMFVWLEIPQAVNIGELVSIRVFALDLVRHAIAVASFSELDCEENRSKTEPMVLSFEVEDQSEFLTMTQLWDTCYSPCQYEICAETFPITTTVSIRVADENGLIEIGTQLLHETETMTASFQLVNDSFEPWTQCNSYKKGCAEIKFVENQGFCE